MGGEYQAVIGCGRVAFHLSYHSGLDYVNEFKWTERSVVLREGEEFDGCRFSSLFHFDEQMTVK